jgi:16S rRNA (adenine1518-N6/adenine1519-N6)-dimethyltransferase
VFRPSPVDVGDAAIFERLVRGAFLQRRKTLLNALEPVAASLGRSARDLIETSRIDPKKRPEAVTFEEFARLAKSTSHA